MTHQTAPAGMRSVADFLAENAQCSRSLAFFIACCASSSSRHATPSSRPRNILNILRQAAPILIVAVAMTFVIMTGGIDLSVGIDGRAGQRRRRHLCSQADLPWPPVVMAMLAARRRGRPVQGWFIAYEEIPAFIVTLAGLSILRGVALWLTQGYSIPISSDCLVHRRSDAASSSAFRVPAVLASARRRRRAR